LTQFHDIGFFIYIVEKKREGGKRYFFPSSPVERDETANKPEKRVVEQHKKSIKYDVIETIGSLFFCYHA
jgi:hypothetical protein